MSIQKTVAAIHDISGMGKCSLTAAIPVLSAAGVSVSVMPTAVLSIYTVGGMFMGKATAWEHISGFVGGMLMGFILI